LSENDAGGKRPLLVTMPIAVKSYDIDFAHIVHNIVYFRWLEDMRLLLLEEIYPLEQMLSENQSPILTKTEIEYRVPVRMGDEVAGQMWVWNLSRVRWHVAAEITVAGQIVSVARQEGYFADLQSLRPIRIPERLHQLWDAAMKG
jgi:acyl-CoA thioester hydrolase